MYACIPDRRLDTQQLVIFYLRKQAEQLLLQHTRRQVSTVFTTARAKEIL
jgi:hypothetical protein